MDQQESNLMERVNHLTDLVTQLLHQNMQELAPATAVQPQQSQHNSNTPAARSREEGVNEIDESFAVHAGIPTNQQNTRRSSQFLYRNEFLQPLPSLYTRPSARSGLLDSPIAPNTTTTPSNNTTSITMVEPVIRIKAEDKVTVITAKSIRYAIRLYREEKRQRPNSKHTLADFLSQKVLKEIYSNEMALGTDLSLALKDPDDLRYIGDDKLIDTMARKYRSEHLLTKGALAVRLYKNEVDKLQWPSNYHDKNLNTWAINPEGFHQQMHTKLLDWIRAMSETVAFVYRGATKEDLDNILPPVTYGTKDNPGIIQIVMRGLGPLWESIKTVISVKKLESELYLRYKVH